MAKLQKQFSIVSQINYPYKLVKQTIKNAKSKIEDNYGKEEIENLKTISLKDIHFKYSDKKIIEKVSLEINNPQFVGLYGKSGIGKTTLVDIISGIIKPDKGEVMINEINLNNINKEKWRMKIGYVPQDTILLNDTLYNNVVLDNKNFKDDDVIECMHLAGLSDFMLENEDFLNISLGEGGRKVSGGIRQRISLARALIRKPFLLILDEATSSLDDETEQKIIQTIKKLKDKMTIIAISHTRTIIKNSNISYKLINGKLISDKRVKIIGAGSIGNHLSNACKVLGWKVDLCDSDSKALERTKKLIYPSRYGKWDKEISLFNMKNVPRGCYDVIFIGTPPDTHVDLALRSIEEKPKAICIEKPVCGPDLKKLSNLLDMLRKK